MKKPNLFIVGAGKCGTTALYHYLNQHADIYMSNPKTCIELSRNAPFVFDSISEPK